MAAHACSGMAPCRGVRCARSGTSASAQVGFRVWRSQGGGFGVWGGGQALRAAGPWAHSAGEHRRCCSLHGDGCRHQDRMQGDPDGVCRKRRRLRHTPTESSHTRSWGRQPSASGEPAAPVPPCARGRAGPAAPEAAGQGGPAVSMPAGFKVCRQAHIRRMRPAEVTTLHAVHETHGCLNGHAGAHQAWACT